MEDVSANATARRARGLDRAFEVLEFLRLGRKPLRPNELAQQMGMPRSTLYELVNIMVRHGILEYRDDDGRVFLGRKLYFLGAVFAEEFDVMRECEQILDRLSQETEETSQLCMLDGNKYTVSLMREGSRPFRISSAVGEPIPLPWTASGRLLVAHMSDEEILAFIPKEDFRLPGGDWVDPRAFIAQVRQAAAMGYFTFNSVVETFTHCFAVPVYRGGNVVAATLCLIAPREDGLKNRAEYIRCLQAAAKDLAAAIGCADTAPIGRPGQRAKG